MASSSSFYTSVPTHYVYDVFLCFTPRYFTAELYEALHRAGIRTFRDDGTREGEDLNPEIERSITTFRASIVVLSENFANSSRCLDELWQILQLRRKVGHFVLPVFYEVDPADVRNQRGSYSIEAKEEGTKWTQDNVRRWKAALTEVADLKGMVTSDYRNEAILILKIVKELCSQLGVKPHSTPPTGLIGIETQAEYIVSWLNNKKPDSPVLAIRGMGGSGKTTLAKHVYYSNKHNFEGCSFLEDIENHPDGLLGVQKQLLRDISGNDNMMTLNVNEGALHVEKIIRMNKVLIVVDDIHDNETLRKLFGTKLFPTQSKIILTTRFPGKDIYLECLVYEVQLLNDLKSLELLSFHAFGSKFLKEGFENVASQLTHYCQGHPLTLKVLGSSMSGKGTIKDMINWESKILSLKSLDGSLGNTLHDLMYKSFKSLPSDETKELFLHIACLFVGERVYDVETILEDDYHAKSGMVTLINRCLLTDPRDSGGKLAMHGLLQEMARRIVRGESKFPAKRSRVWDNVEAYRLLRKGDGSNTIEGLLVNMVGAQQLVTLEAFKTSSLVKMKNLKFLQLNYVQLTGSFENFPDLRWLRWHGCHLKTIPTGLLASCLVAIYMHFGDLEEFDPYMVLNSLKILDLQSSLKLVRICNLYQLPKLETLILDYCTNLTHVCKTIRDLANLSFLSLKGCTKLWKASSNPMIVNQQALCSLPQSLDGLNLSSNLFEIMPGYIDLKRLRNLNLTSCPNLKSLPFLPSMLEELYVDWCTSLEIITFQSARFPLRLFSYEGCYKLCEIQGLFKLVSIETLDEADLEHMQWIKAYQYHKVDLVGDEITKGRLWNIQMLYEYGIRSTFLQGIKDQSMATHEYTSSSQFLSFHVPLHPYNHIIQGLNVTFLYRSSSSEDTNMWPLFARITNISKSVTWVYNPVVYCKPRIDNDVVWLCYWPIGSTLDAGDEVHVHIIAEVGTITASGCGASLVYMNDSEVEKEERCEKMKGGEVIGGDLSGFEVTKGGYYLCRCDLFKSMIPASLFGYNIRITDSRRWRISSPSVDQFAIDQAVNAFRDPYLHMQNLDHLKIALKGIQSATEKFDKKYRIGSGGYGEVYKCELPEMDNSTVAIKRLFSRDDGQGEQGFLSEINVLSRCEHPNIISLLGFCVEDNEMLLVYEYASNGSLDYYLGSTDKMTNLSWAQRLKMCIDIAHGLYYLHTTMEYKLGVIHRDIKSDNILLGKNLEAKIADFGLSKFHLGNQQESTIETNNIAGTNVYLDPEYSRTGKLKKASDIYSFGVVLFEIFTGTLAYDLRYKWDKEKGLAPIVRRHFKRGTLKEMLDPKIVEEASELGFTRKVRPAHESLEVFLRIAYQCIAKAQADRPIIEVVVKELKKALYIHENWTLKIPLDHIKLGTYNFSDDKCIMTGGCWKLYKGKVQYNNRQKKVAVKRFSLDKHFNGTSFSLENSFMKEFEVLFKYKQENIIGLLGYCKEIDEKIVVYEHTSNKSLDRYLYDTNFSCTKRLKICIDIAKGLKFLHGGGTGQDVVLHRDLKSSNILLTKDWKAKICGFEHALSYPTNEKIKYVFNDVEGSLGYRDPLYWETHTFTKETDIYSLGVILFEILCGRLACPHDLRDHSQFLDVLVKHHFQVEQFDEMVFAGIKEQIAPKSLATFQRIAFQCLHTEIKERPAAGEVVVQLQKALEFQEAYEALESTKLHRNYKEILQVSESRDIYATMAKKYINDILSKGILTEDDKLEIIRNIQQTGDLEESVQTHSGGQ